MKQCGVDVDRRAVFWEDESEIRQPDRGASGLLGCRSTAAALPKRANRATALTLAGDRTPQPFVATMEGALKLEERLFPWLS